MMGPIFIIYMINQNRPYESLLITLREEGPHHDRLQNHPKRRLDCYFATNITLLLLLFTGEKKPSFNNDKYKAMH